MAETEQKEEGQMYQVMDPVWLEGGDAQEREMSCVPGRRTTCANCCTLFCIIFVGVLCFLLLPLGGFMGIWALIELDKINSF